MKLPKKIPNLNQIIFNGSSILEFINPSSKNIKEIISSQTLILLPLKSGNNEMIKKTKKNTKPKLRFDESFIFLFIIQCRVFKIVIIY